MKYFRIIYLIYMIFTIIFLNLDKLKYYYNPCLPDCELCGNPITDPYNNMCDDCFKEEQED
jgi:hypothetical protein